MAAELLGGQEGLKRVPTRSDGDISAGVDVDRMAVELMPGAKTGPAGELARSCGSCSVGADKPAVEVSISLDSERSSRTRCSTACNSRPLVQTATALRLTRMRQRADR
jgi:hypothetical protein